MTPQPGDHFAHPLDDPMYGPERLCWICASVRHWTKDHSTFNDERRYASSMPLGDYDYDPCDDEYRDDMRDRSQAEARASIEAGTANVGMVHPASYVERNPITNRLESMSYAAAMRKYIASDARITARVARHLGMPSRTRFDEDRAVEARRGGNRLRRDAWYRAVRSSRRDIIDLIDTIARFVPGMYL